MKQNVTLTISSLLSLVLFMLHLTDDTLHARDGSLNRSERKSSDGIECFIALARSERGSILMKGAEHSFTLC